MLPEFTTTVGCGLSRPCRWMPWILQSEALTSRTGNASGVVMVTVWAAWQR